jgi:uncharacterized protein
MGLEKLSDANTDFSINGISKTLIHEKMGVSKTLIEDIKKVIRKYPDVNRAVVFGSRANGSYKYNSDIDIAVFSNNLLMKDLNLLTDELKELNTIFDFDVLNFEKIDKKELLQNIEKDGIEIYVK